MAQRFKIGSTVYSTGSIDEISLKDILVFNTEVAAIGLPYTWNDVERLVRELDGLSDDEASAHPDVLFSVAVTVWIARRRAGETLTFSEAIDVPINALEFLPDAEDKKPGKPKGAKKPPKASVPVAATPGAESPTTPPTSENGSTTE